MQNTKSKRTIAIIGVLITSTLAALGVLAQQKFPASWEGPVLGMAATLTALFTVIQNIWRVIVPQIEPLTTPQKRRYVRRKKDLPAPVTTEGKKEDPK